VAHPTTIRYDHSVMRWPEPSLHDPGEKRSAWVVYSVGALAIHGLLVGSLLLFGRNATLPRATKLALDEEEMTFDLEYPAASTPSTALGAQALEEESVPETAQPRAREAAPAALTKAHAARAGELIAKGNDISPETEASGPNSSAGTDSDGRAAPEDPAQPRPLLSLDQLGIGDTNPLAVRTPPDARAPRHTGRRERSIGEAQAALQRNIAESITLSDQFHGLGPEGPVLTELVNLARIETTPLNSHARFEFTTDAQGHLLRVTLLQSSSDPRPWQRIAQTIHDRLRGQELRLAHTGKGATFTVKVEVRLALPSGADPGFALNVLGIPLKKGAGPRSTRLDILNLNPMALADPSLGSFGAIAVLRGDLVDIGALTSKQTHAHIESIRINDEKASESPPSPADGGAPP